MDYKSIILSTEISILEFNKGGREFTLPVRIKNGSGADLLSAQRVYLTYHVLSVNSNVLRWDSERTEISVLSGEEEVIDLVGTVPSEAGEYFFQIDIVKEGVEWYSAQGMETIVIPVKVMQKGLKYRELLEEKIQKQNETEKKLKNILLSGEYTFENPYVQLNPYENSPLTAIVLFQTEKPMCISVKVIGKTLEADVKGNLMEYTTEHVIPVYGLYPDLLNTVILSGSARNGDQKEKKLQIQTAPLEGDFSAINLCTYIGNASKYEPGVNFSFTGLEDTGMKYAYDINADIRWYFPEKFAEPTNYKSSNSIWVIKQVQDAQLLVEGMLYEYSLLGRIMSAIVIPFKVHHEIYFTARETVYLLTHSGETLCDAAIEVDCETGELLYHYNYKKMFQRTRNTSEIYTNADWIHMNSLVEHKGDIIVCGNTQSTIMKHDREGNIKWIFADPIGYTTYWKRLALTPTGENFEYFYNPHAIEILPDADGNPDTFDMLLFDNGISRNKCNGLDKLENPPYSRVVHYRIDEKNKTVEQIWEYGKDRKELYSMWRGDANYLTNENILGVFNIRDESEIDGKAYIESCVCVEVDRDKNVIWESYGCSDKVRNSYVNYRMERKQMYDAEEKNIDLNHKVKIVEVKKE